MKITDHMKFRNTQLTALEEYEKAMNVLKKGGKYHILKNQIGEIQLVDFSKHLERGVKVEIYRYQNKDNRYWINKVLIMILGYNQHYEIECNLPRINFGIKNTVLSYQIG